MKVSSINSSDRRNMFISYANHFMSFGLKTEPTEAETQETKKLDKIKGIETLTIFPKQVIDGKMIITA